MQVKKRKLGNSEFSVNPIGLGSMPLSLQGRPTEKEAIRVIHAALEAGMDFIDTADVYCLDQNDIGYCERLIAKALATAPQKTKVVVATKGGLERPHGAWTVNGDPQHLKRACEASLKALNVDCIDLYQWHAPDRKIPLEKSLEALIELKNSGKIKALGLSNVSRDEIIRAKKMTEIASVQNRCNPFDTEAFENGVIDYCEQSGIAFIPYSPVGGSGQKFAVAHNPPLLTLAKRLHSDPFQLVLAWFLAKSPVIIPIPGASRVESAISSAKAMELHLNPEDIKFLDQTFLEA